MTSQLVGSTEVEWDEGNPLKFSFKDQPTKAEPVAQTFEVDLSPLIEVCEHAFLLSLKDYLIDRRNRVSLRTVELNAQQLASCFLTIARLKIFAGTITEINEALLLGISPFYREFSSRSLEALRTAFRDCPHSPIFAPGLEDSDFNIVKDYLGQLGRKKKNILAKALTRASVVEILRIAEELYESGKLDIGYFSFLNLAFAVYCRTDSYRTITLGDLEYRKSENAWYLWIRALKTRTLGIIKIPYRMNSRLADILQDQRDHVLKQYGHLVDKEDHPKLAMFPARGLTHGNTGWVCSHANENYGQLPRPQSYFFFIQRIKAWRAAIKKQINSNVLRHTVATQMAQAGLKAWAIQAVLKHADDVTCQLYVDIFMEGVIEQLSDAIQPAFEHRLPIFRRFRSKFEPVTLSQAIECEDESGRTELVGECGTELRCDAAPLGCYDCGRFIPCYDADHGISLSDVVREIDKYERAGLAYQELIKKGKHIKYKIILVMNACDLLRQSYPQPDQAQS